jgi:hypothetical protein
VGMPREDQRLQCPNTRTAPERPAAAGLTGAPSGS